MMDLIVSELRPVILCICAHVSPSLRMFFTRRSSVASTCAKHFPSVPSAVDVKERVLRSLGVDSSKKWLQEFDSQQIRSEHEQHHKLGDTNVKSTSSATVEGNRNRSVCTVAPSPFFNVARVDVLDPPASTLKTGQRGDSDRK